MEDYEKSFDDVLQLLGDDNAPSDLQTELFNKFDTIIENQSDISNKLDIVIDGQAAISYALYSILGFAILITAFKILWTFLAKWLFGGI